MLALIASCAMVVAGGETPAPDRAPSGPPAVAAPTASPRAADPPAANRPAAAGPTSPARTAEKAQDALLAIEKNVVDQTNAQRARYGLPPLQVDPALMDSARRHASWMARAQRLVHTTSAVAENIAMGQQSSSEAVQCWMSSSGHRANILGRGYRRIGVAAYRTPGGCIYWCQQFCP